MSAAQGRARGTSLWLVPPPGAALELLTRLVASFATATDGPRFPPHLTLLGEVLAPPDDVQVRAARLARQIAPVQVALSEAKESDAYFRAVVFAAEPSPTLLAARRGARAVFARSGEDSFFAHVSVAYGRVPSGKRGGLVRGASDVLPIRFVASALEVWRTEGTVAEWRRLGGFPLAG